MKRILPCFIFIYFHSSWALSQSKEMITSRLDSLFSSYFKEGEPGAAVLIAAHDKIIYRKGFGVADIQTKEKISSRTLFNTGSISKTFVAYGILKLANENRITLLDPLSAYFPDFTNPAIAGKLTIAHLLTHTSGLPDNRDVQHNREFYLWAKDEENFAPLKKTAALEFEPGTRYKYSNPAFNGLALIIEKITGKKWQDYIRKNIFKPAGMKHSTITDGPYPETGVAHGYVRNDKGGFDELDYGEEPTFAAAGNGGVWSSVDELWKYEKAIQKNKFLPGTFIKLSRSVYPFPDWKDKNPSRLGLSWFLTREENLDIIGHTGSQGGFISDYCWIPGQQLFYVLLCNTPVSLSEIRRNVFAILKAGHLVH